MEVKRTRIEVLDNNGINVTLSQIESFIGYIEACGQKSYYIGYYRFDQDDYVLMPQDLKYAELINDAVSEVETYEELEKKISIMLETTFFLTDVFTNYHALTTFKED